MSNRSFVGMLLFVCVFQHAGEGQTYIGYQTNNIAVVVRGSDPLWNTGSLTIGYDGSENSLSIVEGGKVFSNVINLGVGDYYTTRFNQLRITGLGSELIASGTLSVGTRDGRDNSIYVGDNAQLQTTGANIVGGSGTERNTVEISGGARWDAGSVIIGNGGTDNKLMVTDGGKVFCSSLTVGTMGVFQGGNGASVTGVGSELIVYGGIDVGRNGRAEDNRLIISEGAYVQSEFARVGTGNRACDGNSVAVTGGARWDIAGSLILGEGSVGNTILITDGGIMTSQNTQIGIDNYDYYASGNYVEVGGTGSKWIDSGTISIAENNSLTVYNEGEIVAVDGITLTGATLNLNEGGD